METQKTPFKVACDIVGSQAEMARILDITPGMVSQLVNGHRPVPIEHCLAIERAVSGQVTRQSLRPKDFRRIWPDLAEADPILEAQLTEAAKAGLIERRTVVRRADDRAMRAALTQKGA